MKGIGVLPRRNNGLLRWSFGAGRMEKDRSADRGMATSQSANLTKADFFRTPELSKVPKPNWKATGELANWRERLLGPRAR